jgi:hypothetical protein
MKTRVLRWGSRRERNIGTYVSLCKEILMAIEDDVGYDP